jgi:hypothetical protein
MKLFFMCLPHMIFITWLSNGFIPLLVIAVVVWCTFVEKIFERDL